MQTIARRGGALLLAAGMLLAGACRKPKDTQQAAAAADGAMNAALPPGHVPIADGMPTGLEPLTQALLDSGNAAFRQKNYDAALAFYGKARDAQPDHAAPWFGTYMVAQATKNTALADSALRMVRARAPELQSHPGGAAMPSSPGPIAPGAVAPPSHYSPHQPVPAPAKGSPSTASRSS